jgi:hypothetical protein
MLKGIQCSCVLQAAMPSQVDMSPEPDIVVELEKENVAYNLQVEPTLPQVLHLQPSPPSSDQGELAAAHSICSSTIMLWAHQHIVHGQEYMYNSAQGQVQRRGMQGGYWMLQRIPLDCQSTQRHKISQ